MNSTLSKPILIQDGEYLHAELNRQLLELQAIQKISTALRAAETLDEMLPILMDKTIQVLEADAVSIWLYDRESQVLRQVAHRHFPAMALALKPDQGIAGRVFATGEPYVSDDFKTDSRTHPAVRDQVPAGLSGAAVPIRTARVIVGVFFVSAKQPHQLQRDQVQILSTIAEIAGNAIHRTRLHDETRQHLKRLVALREIEGAITTSMDLDFTLGTILDQVLLQLGLDAAGILLLNPCTFTLEYACGRGFRFMDAGRVHLKLGESLAGRVALDRCAFSLPDVAAASQFFEPPSQLAEEKFAAYFMLPLVAQGQVKGVLGAFNRTPVHSDPEWLGFLTTVADDIAIAVDRAQLFERLQRSNVDLALAYDTTLEGWSRALDLRDKETEGHTQRVTATSIDLARAMGMTEAELVHVRRGALLHDIGKMGIPDQILLKPGALTDEEWVIMRKHPEYAFELLEPIAYLRPALDIPYCHHEKWDGSGYPRGLKGEAIPLAARIFAVVDVWDALRSDRPYRTAWPDEKVREHIRSLPGTHFDPRVVEVFLSLVGPEQSRS